MKATPAGSREPRLIFSVQGMNCVSCAAPLREHLARVPGVKAVEVQAATGHVYLQSSLGPAPVLAALQELGYTGEQVTDTSLPAAKERWPWWAVVLAFALALPLCFFSLPAWLQILLATVVQVGFGARWYQSAFRARGLTMDLLVVISSTVAYGTSLYHQWHDFETAAVHYEESALLLAFVWLGRAIEARMQGESRRALQHLLALQAPTVRVQRGEQVLELPLAEVQKGEQVLVRPEERIPVDGKVLEGESMVDTATLTGESFPRSVGPGDRVQEATLNLTGPLVLVAEHIGPEASLGRLVRGLAAAQQQQPPLQRLVDRMVARFLPVVVGAAVLAALVHYLWLEPEDLTHALLVGAAVLVVACPCALGLATPLAALMGVKRALRCSLLLRGTTIFERLQRIRILVVDKTGTLTVGEPKVARAVCQAGFAEEDLRRWVGAVQQASAHPLAKALLTWTKPAGVAFPPAEELTQHPGQGVTAVVEGRQVLLGTDRLLQRQGIRWTEAEEQELGQARAAGYTLVLMGVGEAYAGYFAIEAPLHPDAEATVEGWQQAGWRVILLSGDHAAAVEATAAQLGIAEARAHQSPQDKVTFVQYLKTRHPGQVAMIGDGINDAVALATADVGIAMGQGTAVACEAADVILLRGTIQDLAPAFSIAQLVVRTMRQNIAWVFFYNGAGLILAILGILPPWLAAAAMAASSLCLAINALVLLYVPLPKRGV